MKFDSFNIPWGKGIFARTKRITLELSTVCNLENEHVACPLHRIKRRSVLPERIFDSVLESCQRYHFVGVFSFHLYNEPLMDQRLFHFMDEIKRRICRASLFLMTNGVILNQEVVKELEAHRLDYLGISAYTDAEFERLSKLKSTAKIQLSRAHLDDRLDRYRPQAAKSSARPCYCPLYEICVASTGKVILCPFDWRHRHVFGNLRHESLEDILQRDEAWRVYRMLSSGRRRFNLCQNCPSSRGEAYDAPTQAKL